MSRRNVVDNLSNTLSNLSLSAPGSSSQQQQGNTTRSRSPIDEFFLSYASRPNSKFNYDCDANVDINQTFKRLAKTYKWKPQKRAKEKEKFFQAIDAEFTTVFGDGNNLQTWQRLVVMFGFVGDVPRSITRCRKVLGRYFINIYDFLNYIRRAGVEMEEGVQQDLRFLNKGSLQNLRTYSKSQSLLYPLDFARGSVLKAFLVHMF